jgi:hypothetical protein
MPNSTGAHAKRVVRTAYPARTPLNFMPPSPNFDRYREPGFFSRALQGPDPQWRCSAPGSGTRDLVIVVTHFRGLRHAASLDAGPFDFVDALRTAPQLHAVEFWPPSENFLGDDHGFCISLAGHLLAIGDPPLSAEQEVSIVPHCDSGLLGALLADSHDQTSSRYPAREATTVALISAHGGFKVNCTLEGRGRKNRELLLGWMSFGLSQSPSAIA